MTNTILSKYLQYSKRIAVFGIVQWAVLACASLIFVLLSAHFGIFVDEFISRVVNNVVTCSSALAIAICSGYYAHSAYDNSLKRKIESAITDHVGSDAEVGSNG